MKDAVSIGGLENLQMHNKTVSVGHKLQFL